MPVGDNRFRPQGTIPAYVYSVPGLLDIPQYTFVDVEGNPLDQLLEDEGFDGGLEREVEPDGAGRSGRGAGRTAQPESAVQYARGHRVPPQTDRYVASLPVPAGLLPGRADNSGDGVPTARRAARAGLGSTTRPGCFTVCSTGRFDHDQLRRDLYAGAPGSDRYVVNFNNESEP